MRVLEVVNLEIDSKLGSIVPTTKNSSSIEHLGAEIIHPEQTLQNKTDIYGPLIHVSLETGGSQEQRSFRQ